MFTRDISVRKGTKFVEINDNYLKINDNYAVIVPHRPDCPVDISPSNLTFKGQ